MFGMPSDMGPFGFDTSMLQLTVQLLAGLGLLNFIAVGLGVISLPAFFFILWNLGVLADDSRWRARGIILAVCGVVFVLCYATSNLFGPMLPSWAGGLLKAGSGLALAVAGVNVLGRVVMATVVPSFPKKALLIMFRGLLRSPLRTSLTYLALFVLTLVLCLIYAVLYMIGNATSEKEANFKAIVTHKTTIPSQMPPGYYTEFKRVCMELPEGMRPVNGHKDMMSWSFVLGTTEKGSMRKDTMMFLFALEPDKVLTMMDGLDDLTGEEKELLERACKAMVANPQAIVMSPSRLKAMNVQVGQKIKLDLMNYKDIRCEFDIIGVLPEGKYEGVSFMNVGALLSRLDSYEDTNGKPHPMADKCVNLIWVKLPTKEAFERLGQIVNDRAIFNKVPIKLETASSGIGSWLAAFKDIFFGIKFILVPAMIGIMSLVVANAISISVRERRTEMAVLKVLGFQPRHVLLLVLGEALLVGLLGGGMSSLLAWGLLGNFKFQIMFFGAFFVPINALVYGPLLGMAVAFAGSIGPALSAKNVRVAEVFAKVA